MKHHASLPPIAIGVGLRHQHIAEALDAPASVDFVEVHSENFFAQGGALHHLIEDIADTYPVSLHSTALGLGSAHGIPESHLHQLRVLADITHPVLMSDHAAFAWGQANNRPVHAGDLLPLVYDAENLQVMIKHVDQIQQMMGKQLLVENLSAYLTLPGSSMSEQEFLVALREATGCGLLIDLNNILVNAHNAHEQDILSHAQLWLQDIPQGSIGEFHLAGYTAPAPESLAIDDHAEPVADVCWELYAFALNKFGAVPTLIEWDNRLPSWSRLLAETAKARKVAHSALSPVGGSHG